MYIPRQELWKNRRITAKRVACLFKHEKQLFHPVSSGSNQDFGTTKAAKMYFSLSDPGPDAFARNLVNPPKFSN